MSKRILIETVPRPAGDAPGWKGELRGFADGTVIRHSFNLDDPFELRRARSWRMRWQSWHDETLKLVRYEDAARGGQD